MAYLEELLPEFRKGAKIRCSDWIDDFYIQKDGQTVIDHNNRTFHIHAEDTLSDQWELYKEPIDWQYIIDNKCLCWFWDEGEEEKKVAGLLADYDSSEVIFSRYRGKNTVTRYDHCRPVHRDEVTFYEDRKDVAKD